MIYKIDLAKKQALIDSLGVDPFYDNVYINEDTIVNYLQQGMDIDGEYSTLNGDTLRNTYLNSLDVEDLRLYDYISEDQQTNVKNMNLDLIDGVTKSIWNFSRGAKTYRDYTGTSDELVAKVEYNYVMTNEQRQVESLEKKITWYNKDGSIGLEKIVPKPQSIKNLRNLNREIKQGRIDYMDAAAKDLPGLAQYVPEPYKSAFIKAPSTIKVIHKYYKEEMDLYIYEEDSRRFEEAVINETNEIMIEILNLNVRPPDETFASGLTIRQTIIHQLTGVY